MGAGPCSWPTRATRPSGRDPAGPIPPGGLATSDTWVVFDVFVNDTAGPIVRPVIP